MTETKLLYKTPLRYFLNRLPETARKRSDTVGELVGYAASAAKREMRVGASGRWANQAATRSRLRAAAVATVCRPVLASPRSRAWRRPNARTPCESVLSTPW